MSETSLLGIRFRIHPLFWLVVGLSIAAGYFLETLALFVIVIIHELGHIAAARELGWHIREIQLLPFGGIVAIDEELEADPLDEIVVALAGPFMNVTMVAISFLFWKTGVWSDEWTRFFMTSNWLIAGFNLIPVWPLDGGRIVQALLCYFLAYRVAVLGSLGASCLLAGLMLGIGFLEQHVQLVIASTYLAILNAKAFVRFPFQFIRFLLGKHAGSVGINRIYPVTVEPNVTLLQAVQCLRKGQYHVFHVSGRGIVEERRLLHALLFEQKHQEPIARLL
ncbi:M50 family metallopeptidase [Brevibacillus humidisoli]|uniref:M50 family metallopeptidase n=1 Tax=Brevibacillus humidisoli TaxID=2895522 RepID=UPI001E3AFF90|nr:M50 family metallopeptidase [Brevibacillus humidisoli]UFJ39047.1 M50 family metallopeptidase [Brevibacillus humidisoli]